MKQTGDGRTAENRAGRILPDVAKTLLILLVATLLCEGLHRLGLGEQNISIVMVLAVFFIAATTQGYWYGLAATVAGVLIYDFLVTEPRFGFSITLGFPITLSIMLLVALATSTITARIKKQAKTARDKELRAELLYDINRKLLSSRDEATIARYALEYLKDDLHRSVALFTSFEPNTGPAAFYFRQAEGDAASDYFCRPAEQAAATRAFGRNQSMGAGTLRPGGAAGHYRPVATQGEVYGVLGIACENGPVPEARLPFLELITEQTAQALRVQALATKQQETVVMAETEKARNSFLRGISHDLRTPLTGIIGASSTLLENPDELPQATRAQLAESIQSDAEWLLSLVENVLSITKVQQNNMTVLKTEEAVEEVVGEAVAAFRRRHPGAVVTVIPPRELLLASMDALLVTQVINNLLDNAWRHGGAGVAIAVEIQEQNGFAEISVLDNGPGIRPEIMASLFEMQPGRATDASRGMGIGLTICRAIVEAHDGWIEGHNNPAGGARFSFGLPLEKEAPNE